MGRPSDTGERLAALQRGGRHERGGSPWRRTWARFAPALGRVVPRERAIARATRAGERQWEESKAARKKAVRWMAMMLKAPEPDPEVQRLAREAVIDWHVRQVLIERPWEARRGTVRDLEHVEAGMKIARQEGVGVLIPGTHMSLGMLGAYWLARRFRPIYVVRAPRHLEREGPQALVVRRRARAAERYGARWVDRQNSYDVMRALLLRGELCTMAFDGGGDVETELAGQRTWLAGGTVALAFETGAVIMPGLTVHEGSEQVGRSSPPLFARDFADPQAMHRHIAELFSRWILEYLPQYYPHTLPRQPRASWKKPAG